MTWAADGHLRELTLKLRKGQVQDGGGGSCYRRAHTRMCTRTCLRTVESQRAQRFLGLDSDRQLAWARCGLTEFP